LFTSHTNKNTTTIMPTYRLPIGTTVWSITDAWEYVSGVYTESLIEHVDVSGVPVLTQAPDATHLFDYPIEGYVGFYYKVENVQVLL
jgi:hypothetical protein